MTRYLLFACLSTLLFATNLSRAQQPSTNCSGNCLYLPSGYAHAGENTTYNNMTGLTMQAWINPSSLPTTNNDRCSIVSKWGNTQANNQFAMFLELNSGNVELWAQVNIDGSVYSVRRNAMMQTGQWYHVSATWKSNTSLELYINGVLIDNTISNTGTALNYSTSEPLRIGSSAYVVESNFKGYIDEVQIYNTKLTAQEINQSMNTTAYNLPFYNSIVSYWRFQDATNLVNDIAPYNAISLQSGATLRNTIMPCQVPDFGPITIQAFPASNKSIQVQWVCPPALYPVSDPVLGGQLKFELYREGALLTTLTPVQGMMTYIDNTFTTCRNAYYVKPVWTFPNSTTLDGPVSNTAIGATPDFGFRTSQGTYTNKTVLTWNTLSSATGGYEVKRDGQQIALLPSANMTTYTDFDGIPGKHYSYRIVPITNPAGQIIVCDETGWVKENGRLSGYVRSPLNAPVANVVLTATSTILGQTYTYKDTTDASGFYEIRNVYYSDEATYTLVPSKGTHQFNPPGLERTLDLLAFNAPQANFTDTSVFTVSGRVYFPNQAGNPGCGDKNVKVLVNGQDIGIVTDAGGNFTYTAQEEGTYTFTPAYPNHTFVPASRTLNISDNTGGVDFKDATTDSLWIDLKGYCNTQVADSFTVRIEGATAGCYTLNRTIGGNTINGFGLVLPAQEYSVELTAVDANNANAETAIINSFQGLGSLVRLVDLRNRDSVTQTTIVANAPIITSDTLALPNGTIVINNDTLLTYDTITQVTGQAAEVKYIYGGRLSVEVLGVDPSCNNTVIFKQGNLYNMRVRVWRNYNYLGNQSCPVDTGKITMFDDVSDSSFIYFTLDTFFVNYKINPGAPNISASGAHPYQKFISIHAQTWDAISADTSFWAIVAGNKSLTSTFLTKTPELPMFILHDPAGDGSSATLSEGATLSYGYETSIETGTSTNVFANVSLAAEVPVPFTGIVFSAGGSLNASITSDDVNTSNQSVNVAFTTLNSYSTSDGEDYVGEDADVVVGGSLNMIYGLSYIVKADENTCQVDLDTAMTWGAEDFATTYMYTIGHIKNTLIPQMDYLIGFYSKLGSDSALIYQNYKNVWQQVVDKNHANIANAEFKENRSFSGGVAYSNTTSYENTNSMTIGYQASINSSIAAAIKAGTDNNNAEAGTEVNFTWTASRSTSTEMTNSKEVGFTLTDDDAGDFFSVDIKRDKVYGTPVFNLQAGTSSCPHEEGTQQRDMPEIVVQTPNVQNVPINSQATLTVKMSNFSESQETRTYEVIIDPNSNMEGAVVRLSGQVITQGPATFTIPAKGSVFATMSVEAGPVAVDYNNLKLIIYSPCDPDIMDEALFNIGFQSSCSDITLFTPSNNWLVNGANEELRITYGGYNVNDTSLLQVGLEMRRTGLGWTSIASSIISRSQLAQNGLPYYVVDLDMSSMADGPYEIRAYADCASAGTRSYSVPLSGVIDRTSITLLGTPSPGDGTLNINEEVSVSFSEDIDCSHFFNLQSLVPYAVTLVRADNGDPVAFTYVCSGDKIVYTIAGSVLNTLQNVLLTASVGGFYDINGNILSHPIVWSFIVNNSVVFWQPSGANASVATGGTSSFTGILKNAGNTSEAFTLSSIPSWLNPTGVPASIAQGATVNINFNISGAGLNPGVYNDTVYADFTNLGIQQPLYVQLTVYANSPAWAVVAKPSQMNIIANFSLTSANTPLSVDANDRVGVFYGKECRGVANIQYTPAGNSYAAYITVYGNNGAQPQEQFEFRIWDASTATEYQAVEVQAFVENAQVGQPLAPMILHPAGVVQHIPLVAGWNWVSTYLQPNNPGVNTVLKYTANATGNIIKTNDTYAQYGANGIWSGTLQQIGWKKSYQIMVSAPTELQIVGQPIVDTVTIPVVSGWNWIGYPYDEIRTTTDYMHSFGNANNDVIQSSTQFSTFASSVWNGSLQSMQPGRGYKLKAATGGNILVEPRSAPDWHPDIFGNEFNMNITAVVKANGNAQMGNFIVGAFINGICAGVSSPQLAGSSPRVFLTLHGETADNGSSLQFFIYDYNTDSVYTPTYTPVSFTTDGQEATIENAFELNLESPLSIRNISDDSKFVLHQNVPNPFNGNTMIRIDVPREEHITLQVFDYTGKLVAELVNGKLSQGIHTIQYNPQNLESGIYFYRMQAGGFHATKKMFIY
jgi:hypothetical protein